MWHKYNGYETKNSSFNIKIKVLFEIRDRFIKKFSLLWPIALIFSVRLSFCSHISFNYLLLQHCTVRSISSFRITWGFFDLKERLFCYTCFVTIYVKRKRFQVENYGIFILLPAIILDIYECNFSTLIFRKIVKLRRFLPDELNLTYNEGHFSDFMTLPCKSREVSVFVIISLQ